MAACETSLTHIVPHINSKVNLPSHKQPLIVEGIFLPVHHTYTPNSLHMFVCVFEPNYAYLKTKS